MWSSCFISHFLWSFLLLAQLAHVHEIEYLNLDFWLMMHTVCQCQVDLTTCDELLLCSCFFFSFLFFPGPLICIVQGKLAVALLASAGVNAGYSSCWKCRAGDRWQTDGNGSVSRMCSGMNKEFMSSVYQWIINASRWRLFTKRRSSMTFIWTNKPHCCTTCSQKCNLLRNLGNLVFINLSCKNLWTN